MWIRSFRQLTGVFDILDVLLNRTLCLLLSVIGAYALIRSGLRRFHRPMQSNRKDRLNVRTDAQCESEAGVALGR